MAGNYGLGAKLIVADDSTTITFIEITNLGDINMTADDIDVSSHASRIKTYIKGQVELGEVPFTGNYLTTQGPDILDFLTDANSTETQTIVVPDKFRMTFPGYVKGFGFGVPHDGKVSMSGAIKIAGSVSLFATTS